MSQRTHASRRPRGRCVCKRGRCDGGARRVWRLLTSHRVCHHRVRGLVPRSYIAALLLLFCFIYSVLGMQLFGGSMEIDGVLPRNNFDTLHWAFISVFQILSGEAWNEIMYIGVNAGGWGTALFFISWVIIGQYILLNVRAPSPHLLRRSPTPAHHHTSVLAFVLSSPAVQLFLAVLLDNFSNWEEEEAEVREAMLRSLRRKKSVAVAKATLAAEHLELKVGRAMTFACMAAWRVATMLHAGVCSVAPVVGLDPR